MSCPKSYLLSFCNHISLMEMAYGQGKEGRKMNKEVRKEMHNAECKNAIKLDSLTV